MPSKRRRREKRLLRKALNSAGVIYTAKDLFISESSLVINQVMRSLRRGRELYYRGQTAVNAFRDGEGLPAGSAGATGSQALAGRGDGQNEGLYSAMANAGAGMLELSTENAWFVESAPNAVPTEIPHYWFFTPEWGVTATDISGSTAETGFVALQDRELTIGKSTTAVTGDDDGPTGSNSIKHMLLYSPVDPTTPYIPKYSRAAGIPSWDRQNSGSLRTTVYIDQCILSGSSIKGYVGVSGSGGMTGSLLGLRVAWTGASPGAGFNILTVTGLSGTHLHLTASTGGCTDGTAEEKAFSFRFSGDTDIGNPDGPTVAVLDSVVETRDELLRVISEVAGDYVVLRRSGGPSHDASPAGGGNGQTGSVMIYDKNTMGGKCSKFGTGSRGANPGHDAKLDLRLDLGINASISSSNTVTVAYLDATGNVPTGESAAAHPEFWPLSSSGVHGHGPGLKLVGYCGFPLAMNFHGGDMYSGSYWSTGSLFAVSSTLAFVYDIVSEHHAPGTSNGPGFDNSVSAARRSTDIDDASGYVVKISASTPAQVNNDGAINQVFNPEHPSGEG